MSITRTQLNQENNVTNTNAFDTAASISPSPNSYVLILVRSHWTTAGSTTLTVSSNAGLNLSWSVFTNRAFNTAASPLDQLFIGAALTTGSPGTGTVHLLFGKTTSGAIWEIIQVDGADLSGGTNTSPVQQSGSGGSDTAGTTLTDTFSSNVNANNAVFACCGQANKNGGLYTWNNSFTEDVDVGSTESTAYNLSTGHILSGFSGTTHTVTSTSSTVWAILGAEIKAAASTIAEEEFASRQAIYDDGMRVTVYG